MKEDLKSMSLSQMEQAFSALGEPKFRAKQVFTWLHKGVTSFDQSLQAAAREVGRDL